MTMPAPISCICASSIFTPQPVTDFAPARRSDTERYAAFFRQMLARGIFLPPSQFEAMFVSLAHSDDEIQQTIEAARESLTGIR